MSFGYWLFLLMIIPVVAGMISWLKFHTINWKESLISTGAALLVILGVLGMGQCSNQWDTETWSGRITKAIHIPEWTAEWSELETYTTTDSKGNVRTRTRWVTRREHHSPTWEVETTIGNFGISESFFHQICQEHGIQKERGYRPNYDSGDKWDYFSYVNDDPEFCDYPVTTQNTWMNPLKNTKSLHSFRDLGEDEAINMGLPSYPINETFKSSRIIGDVNISIWNWDKMNSALGHQKKVNIILVRLNSVDQAKHLQNYWKNGKKNDLVICFGGSKKDKAEWCYVFGWSESELVKLNLQSLFLEKPVNDYMLEDIKQIVRKDFKPHEWSQYEHLDKMIPTGWVVTAFILMIVVQGLLYYYFHIEEI